ncbi:MAG: C4-type zinc ribbon domain-containing protein [Pseudomonadota bacterium]
MNSIEKLLHVQQLDRELDDIQAQAQIFPDRLTQVRQAEDQARRTLGATRVQLETLEKAHKDASETLDLETQRLKKSQVRIKQLKTAYEFQALNREIENTKRSNTELEELILQRMEELETLRKMLADQEAAWNHVKEELVEVECETKARLAEFESVLSAKREELTKARKDVEKAILSRYMFIRDRKYSDAVVAIRDGSCSGCYMQLPHQMLNEIRRSLEIASCPACSRLIFYVEPAPTA